MENQYDKKGIKEFLGLITERQSEKGVIFYEIKQNFPSNWTKISDNILLSKEESWKCAKIRIKEIKNNLKRIDMVEMAYMSISENKKRREGYPEIRMLVGIRSLTGKKQDIKTALLKEFLYGEIIDISIKEKNSKKKIKKYWDETIKNTKTRAEFRNHYMYIYRKDEELYGGFYDYIEEAWSNLEYGECLEIEHKHKEIMGVKSKNKYVLINLWSIFMQINELIQDEGIIYKRNRKSQQTYERIGDIKILKKETAEILKELRLEFPNQLGEIDIKEIISEYYIEAIKIVEEAPWILPSKKVNENWIEYKNGIYDKKERNFISYKSENEILKRYLAREYKEREYKENK